MFTQNYSLFKTLKKKQQKKNKSTLKTKRADEEKDFVSDSFTKQTRRALKNGETFIV